MKIKHNNYSSLIDVFIQSLAVHANNIALVVNGKHYSYAVLFDRALEIANALVQMAPKKTCAIYIGRQLDAYAAILASLLCNKPIMQLSINVPMVRSILLLKHSNADVLLVDENSLSAGREIAADYALPIINTTFCTRTGALPAVKVVQQDNCYLLYTSGTTGTPKGVMITHQQILLYLEAMIERLQPTAMNRFSQITDLTFDITIHELFMSWSVGAAVYVILENQFVKLAEFIQKNALTHLTMVPSVVAILINHEQLKCNQFPSVFSTLFGGEALTYAIARKWQTAAPNSQIENHYGPTEGTIAVTAYVIPRNELDRDGIVPIGRFFSNQHYAILDAATCKLKKCGELYIAGPQVATGYWQQPELDQGRFARFPNSDLINAIWYATGDRVQVDDTGCLHFCGRKDHQLQIRGCRVEKLEIELVLKKICHSQEVTVLPWPVSSEGNVLGTIAFVVAEGLSERAVRNAASKCLPSMMVPSHLIFLKTMPLTSHHKIDYMHLKLMAAQYFQQGEIYGQ